MTKIQVLGEIELPLHPAYTPDLARLDYHLFQLMAHFLRVRNFEHIGDILNILYYWPVIKRSISTCLFALRVDG